jgi:hypothetical protein
LKELSLSKASLTPAVTAIFKPEKFSKRRARQGYGDGEETPNMLWSKGKVKDFIEKSEKDGVELLGKVVELDWEDGER